jgi:hypothetical protein
MSKRYIIIVNILLLWAYKVCLEASGGCFLHTVWTNFVKFSDYFGREALKQSGNSDYSNKIHTLIMIILRRYLVYFRVPWRCIPELCIPGRFVIKNAIHNSKWRHNNIFGAAFLVSAGAFSLGEQYLLAGNQMACVPSHTGQYLRLPLPLPHQHCQRGSSTHRGHGKNISNSVRFLAYKSNMNVFSTTFIFYSYM